MFVDSFLSVLQGWSHSQFKPSSEIKHQLRVQNLVFFSISVQEYEGESVGNQSNLFPVEIHLFFFDVMALSGFFPLAHSSNAVMTSSSDRT